MNALVPSSRAVTLGTLKPALQQDS